MFSHPQRQSPESAVALSAFSTPAHPWLVACTQPRHEKAVAEYLRGRGVEHFLPMYDSARQWSDRKVKISQPLFPGYLFTRIALAERLQVLEAPGVLRLVSFGTMPATVPESELTRLRMFLEAHQAEPHPYLAAGQKVVVVRGALAGMEGVLVRRKSATRVVILMRTIQQAFSTELEASDVDLA